MDEVLLRRLVGATVLFGAAFSVASLLPDAPQRVTAGSSQTVRFDLNGRPEAVAETEPEAAQPVEPAPGADAAVSERPESGSGWYVQVGSFENQDNARKALVALYDRDLPVVIKPVHVDRAIWYRVRVGPYISESEAQDALARLPGQSFKGARVIHIGGETDPG